MPWQRPEAATEWLSTIALHPTPFKTESLPEPDAHQFVKGNWRVFSFRIHQAGSSALGLQIALTWASSSCLHGGGGGSLHTELSSLPLGPCISKPVMGSKCLFKTDVPFNLKESEDEELCLLTSGKLSYSLSWALDENGIPLTPVSQSLSSAYCR